MVPDLGRVLTLTNIANIIAFDGKKVDWIYGYSAYFIFLKKKKNLMWPIFHGRISKRFVHKMDSMLSFEGNWRKRKGPVEVSGVFFVAFLVSLLLSFELILLWSQVFKHFKAPWTGANVNLPMKLKSNANTDFSTKLNEEK